jgi:nucleotide-binding universal stress UspA family protein
MSKPGRAASIATMALTTATDPAHRILLAVEPGGASSDRAVAEAIELAARDRAELIVMSVVEPARVPLPGRASRRPDQERERLEGLVRPIVARARATGVSATWLVWDGDPGEVIPDAADAEGADLIVMGSHGRGPVGRLLLGSVSRRVLDQARCRVVVVPSH